MNSCKKNGFSTKKPEKVKICILQGNYNKRSEEMWILAEKVMSEKY